MLPEGTHLTGSIFQAKPVRWLAQNGKLRFTVRGIELPAGSEQQAMEHTVHSLMTAAEAAPGQGVSFACQTEALRQSGEFRNIAIDGVGFMISFKAVVIEGMEVVFIVIAVGATVHMLLPASLGALAAGLLVILLGLVLHKPLARIPENTLKFSVGVLLSAFGVIWIGEGLHLPRFGEDWVIVGLIIYFGSTALGAVRIIRRRAAVQRGLSR
jgi:putative Ca2+/H+ antiporter (TMEM165/GDT1 family)